MAKSIELTPEQTKTLHNILYAEGAGGNPEEIQAIASVFLNRVANEGADKAFNGSSAYRKQSKQYQKALSGDLNDYEQMVYQHHGDILNGLLQDQSKVQPFTYMENVKAYGDPSWSSGMQFQDIGRQRFYMGQPKKASHYGK